jgi:carbon monoxide dehydrogenase subunit G
MLLAATEYVRPDSLEDALAALGATAGSRVLAGGQTLINVLKHRAASVELLVDAVLSDPARLAETLPGVGDVTIEDECHFSAVAHPITAVGETRVAMDFEIVEQRPSEHVRISGLGSAGENQLQPSIALDLAPDDEGTVASWSADVQLRGVLRSLLQRGLGSLFNEQVEAVLTAGALLSEASNER